MERQASRADTVPSEVVLGGRKVALRLPRVRANGEEVPLLTFRAMASEDPLNRRVVELAQMNWAMQPEQLIHLRER